MKTTLTLMLLCLSGVAFASGSPSSLEEAKKLAASENKPLLIDFYHPN